LPISEQHSSSFCAFWGSFLRGKEERKEKKKRKKKKKKKKRKKEESVRCCRAVSS